MVRATLSLKARALQWLAQREHSRIELRRKLLRVVRVAALVDGARIDTRVDDGDADRVIDRVADRAASEAEVDALLDWLTAQRYLSEARFVEARIHARAGRFGNLRINHELAQHGTRLDALSAERLKHSEFERAKAVWSRKFGGTPAADAAERAKQMRFLAGRGFSTEVILKLVRGHHDG